MCVGTINGEISNHTIQEEEPTKDEDIFEMDNSAVILSKEELEAHKRYRSLDPGQRYDHQK